MDKMATDNDYANHNQVILFLMIFNILIFYF